MKTVLDTNILMLLAGSKRLEEECENGEVVIPVAVLEEARKKLGSNKYLDEAMKKMGKCIVTEARFNGGYKETRVPSRKEYRMLREMGERPDKLFPVIESIATANRCKKYGYSTVGVVDGLIIAMGKDNNYRILSDDTELRECAKKKGVKSLNFLEYTQETFNIEKKIIIE